MRKTPFAIVIVAALAVSVCPAAAADLLSAKAPPPSDVRPPPLWDGFYAGLNAGYVWSDSAFQNQPYGLFFGPLFPAAPVRLPAVLAATPAAVSGSGGGFIGGGQIGYNWQFAGSLAAGVEADIQGATLSRSGNGAVLAGGLPAPFQTESVFGVSTGRATLDYLGTLRGRIGYLVTPTLLAFATGGLAYGGVTHHSGFGWTHNIPVVPSTFPFAVVSGSYADTRVGWTAGGGLEWMFWRNWSAKVEYLYYDLGASTTGTVGVEFVPEPFLGVGARQTVRHDGHIVRAGLNYHVSWGAAPIVAKY